MTGSERNAFEKELQKHPFEAEAMEGLSIISPENIEKDLADLKANISPSKHKNRFQFLAAAATILLLITAGVIWIQIRNQNQTIQTAETQAVKPAKNRAQKYELIKTEPEQHEIEMQLEEPVIEKEQEKHKTITPPPKTSTTKQTDKKIQQNNSQVLVMVSENQEKESTESLKEQQKTKSVRSHKLGTSDKSFAGAAVTAPTPVATISPLENSFENSDAHPIIGFKNYQTHLDSTAVLPADYKKKRVKVKIQFYIDEEGNISRFQNINKADSLLFEKACDLIKNGSRWIPKTDNGKRIHSTVTLKIIFRKKS